MKELLIHPIHSPSGTGPIPKDQRFAPRGLAACPQGIWISAALLLLKPSIPNISRLPRGEEAINTLRNTRELHHISF